MKFSPRQFLQNSLFSDSLELNVRIVNMTLCLGLAAAGSVTLGRLITAHKPAVILISLVFFVSIAGLLAVVNLFKLYRAGVLIFILVLYIIMFSVAFFINGGANGIIPIYFVFTLAIIFFLTSGTLFFILLFSHITWIIVCYNLASIFPQWVITQTTSHMIFDQIQAILTSAFFIGIIVKYQKFLYVQEKQKVEDALEKMHEANEHVRIMLDATPLVCTVWDMNLNVIDCNTEALKLFGFSDKQDLLEKFYALSPEFQEDGMPSVEKQKELFTRVINNGKTSVQWLFRRLDGVQIPAETTVNRVISKAGDFFLVFIRDLREYTTMMEEIMHRGSLLNAVNSISTILLKSDPKNFEKDLGECMGLLARSMNVDHIHIWKNKIADGELWSELAYEWSGENNTESTKLKMPVFEIPGWQNLLVYGNFYQGFLKNTSEKFKKAAHVGNYGAMLLVPVFLQEFFWGFVGFYDYKHNREFTSREITILQSGSLLIGGTMQRNEMIGNLIKAREDALSSTRAKSDFLANMSHEMRTPMNAIIGMTNIAGHAQDLSKKDYCLSKIADASHHLLGVINDILDMSKIEANKFELSISEFNFEKTLNKAVNVVNFRVEEKRQLLTVHLGEGIPQNLIGDDQRITQVIANLLSNAVKFTPEKGKITLKSFLIGEEITGEGDTICTIQTDVTDTGIGIDADQKKRLFHSFEQADSHTSRKFGGTGLGLAISKNIVEMMKGRIWVDSEPDKGSTFSFTMKLKRGEEAPVTKPAMEWNDIRVLAVDDDANVLEYFSDFASRHNLTCDTAPGGKEAIEMIEKSNGYDIYFVDWNMPVMDGNALTRYIKSRNGSKQSVVVTISSFEWTIIEDEAKSAGVDQFLPKPLFPYAITDMINSCLGLTVINDTENTARIQKFPGKKILLVEDIDINREILQSLLEPTEIMVDCAVNGKEAVGKYCAVPENYDIIFMDIQMPEMDGYEATRKIRTFEAEQKIRRPFGVPIIAMTANVFREDVEKCLASGMNSHVGKPLDMEEVIKKITEFIS